MRYSIYIILGLLIVTAIFTNPDQDRHKEILKNKINPALQKSIKENSNKKDNNAIQALGLAVSGALVGTLIDNLVSTDNYVLFSTTKITWDGETKIIGIGAFGNVFLSDKLNDVFQELDKK